MFKRTNGSFQTSETCLQRWSVREKRGKKKSKLIFDAYCMFNVFHTETMTKLWNAPTFKIKVNRAQNINYYSKMPITFRTFSNAFTKTSVFCSALLRSKAVWIYWLNSIRKGRSFRWLENQFSKTTKWTQISMVVKIWFYLSTKLNYVYCGVKPIYMGMSVWFGLV